MTALLESFRRQPPRMPIPRRRAPRGEGSSSSRSTAGRAVSAAPGIAQRIGDVADEAVATDPLDRRSRRRAAEAGIVEGRQFGQRRRGSSGRGWKARSRLPPARTCSRGRRPGSRRSRRCGCRSAARSRGRDGALVFDRQIGDAAPGVEPVGRGKAPSDRRPGRRGTGRNGRLARVRRQFEGGATARPGTATSRSARDTRLVCLPCQPMPAACGQRLFHHRRGVDEQLYRRPKWPAMNRARASGLVLQHVVVVGAAGVDRDIARLAPAARPRVVGGA